MNKSPILIMTLKSYAWLIILCLLTFLVLVVKGLTENNVWISNGLVLVYVIGVYVFIRNVLCKRIFKQEQSVFFQFRYVMFITTYLLAFFLTHAFVLLIFNKPFSFYHSTQLINGVLFAFFAAFIEELLFRTVVLSNFIYFRVSIWFPILFSSILFGLIHFWTGKTPIETYMIYTFLMGVLMGLMLWIYKNIWMNISFHFSINSYNKIINMKDFNSDVTSPFAMIKILPLVFICLLLVVNYKKLRHL